MNEDDGADTARNVTAAQQLVEQEKVFAVLPESAAGDASGKYLHDQGIPAVGWQLGLAVYGTYPNFFGFQNANVKDIQTHYVARPIEAVKALGAKKIAVIGNSTGNAATFAEQNADSVKKTKGLKLVYKTTDIPTGTTEFGAVVDQIKQSGADTVYTTMAVTDGIALVNALKQAGVYPKIIVFPGGYAPSVLNHSRVRQRVLQPRVRAVGDHTRAARHRGVQEVDGAGSPERNRSARPPRSDGSRPTR